MMSHAVRVHSLDWSCQKHGPTPAPALSSSAAHFGRSSVAQRFLADRGTRSCVMSVLNNYLSDYYALHTAFSLHLSLLGLLPLLLHP